MTTPGNVIVVLVSGARILVAPETVAPPSSCTFVKLPGVPRRPFSIKGPMPDGEGSWTSIVPIGSPISTSPGGFSDNPEFYLHRRGIQNRKRPEYDRAAITRLTSSIAIEAKNQRNVN